MEQVKSTSTKRNRIIYWIATVWLALGMAASGIPQLLRAKEQIDLVNSLGYPVYLLSIIGTWKLLGVIAVLVPKFPLLKEWTYAGFFFLASGALVSHVFAAQGIKEMAGPLLLIVLTIASWYFRPANRKISTP